MKIAKLTTTLFFISSLFILVHSQNITLTTQAQVDAFNPSATVIDGDLWIGTWAGTNSDIDNLANLANLSTVTGDIDIVNNSNLSSLGGLSNLNSIGGNLNIKTNEILSNINHLSNLNTVEGNLKIYENVNLSNIDGLSNLNSVGGFLHIRFNSSLMNIDGLSNTTYIGNELIISDSDALTNLDGLSNLTATGGHLGIHSNDILTDISGLANITSIGENLYIAHNEALTNLDALSNLTHIAEDLILYNNNALLNVDGLSNIYVVNSDLNIFENDQLLNLDGFSNITYIGEYLTVAHNGNLTDINGLSNIDSVGSEVRVYSNYDLSNCCGIQYLLFNQGSIGGDINIFNNASPCDSELSILEQDCGLNLHSLRGDVVLDYDVNCLLSNGDIPKSGVIVEATKPGRTFTSITNNAGEYAIFVDAGIYEIKAYPVYPYSEPCVESSTAEILETAISETIETNIPLEIDAFCPYMVVDISSGTLRECFDNNYNIYYCNTGTLEAIDAFIELELDQLLTIESASIPFTGPNIDNIYTFDLGNVAINDCGYFTMNLQLPCDTLNAGQYLGRTLCVNAHIYPDSLCLPTHASWDGSSTEVSSYCNLDSVYFSIRNKGDGDMMTPRIFQIIEDETISHQEEYQLSAGEEITVSFFANGSTFRLEAEQAENHPIVDNNPSTAIEACGLLTPFSLGFINQYPLDPNNPFVAIECLEVTGSYDPNDKQAFPIGYGEEHYIEKNTEIEYLIRFQNTGTDTAFTVIIKDIISPLLDLTTIRGGASSHPYTIQMTDSLVEFVFNDILLVDSLTNEAESHGFVKFRISQKPDLAIGSVIENTAGIYFDFNAPIITNTTFHTIGEDFIAINLSSNVNEIFGLTSVKVYPNPFSEVINFKLDGTFKKIDLTIYDIAGKEIIKQSYSSSQFQFNRKNLINGVYFYKLSSKGINLASGKMFIQ